MPQIWKFLKYWPEASCGKFHIRFHDVGHSEDTNLKLLYKIAFGLVHLAYMKNKWVLCLDLGPIPKMSH